MLLPSRNPFKCHEEVLSLQPMFPPKRFGIPPPVSGCSEDSDAFRSFFEVSDVSSSVSVFPVDTGTVILKLDNRCYMYEGHHLCAVQ